MPWSGGLTTIRVPADATDGGGVPYIDIGADVPAEIATDMTAGLIWQSGQPVTGMYGFRYWAFGIMKSGRLEFVLYWFQDVSAGAGLYQYYRRTALSLAPPIGADQPAVLSLGGGDYSTYGEGLFRVVGTIDPVVTQVPFTFRPGWTQWGAGTKIMDVRRLATGQYLLSGVVKNGTGVVQSSGRSSVIANIDLAFDRPATEWPGFGIVNGSVSGGVGMLVRPNGDITLDAGSVPINGGLAFNFTYIPGV
jgi:hypothetical protein